MNMRNALKKDKLTTKEYVIYGIYKDRKTKTVEVTTKKPEDCLEYKEFEKIFESDTNLDSFGFIPKKKLLEQGGILKTLRLNIKLI